MDVRLTCGLIVTVAFSQFSACSTLYAPFSGKFETHGIFGQTFAALAVGQMVGILIGKIISMIWMSRLGERQRFYAFMLSFPLSVIPFLPFAFCGPDGQVILTVVSGVFDAFIWGLTLFYVEGRTQTDLVVGAIYIVFITAAGAYKTIGTLLIDAGLSENWMPLVCGCLALPFNVVSGLVLARWLPKPDSIEAYHRGSRNATTGRQQLQFVREHWLGIVLITVACCAASMFQSYRNYYALEFWSELYPSGFKSSVYVVSEIVAGVIAVGLHAGVFFVKSERWAFFGVIGLMIFGCLWMLIPTLCYRYVGFSGVTWNYLVGVGIYLAFIPPGAILYDKLIGLTRNDFTAVYPMYITGSAGSIASLIILIVTPIYFKGSYVRWFERLSYITAGVVFVCMAGAIPVFLRIKH